MSDVTAADSRPQITDDSGQVQNVGLDQLLAEATSVQRRFVPGTEALKAAGLLARHPRALARHTATAASDLAQVVTGRSSRVVPRGDGRFRDPAWTRNWLFKRLCLGYLGVGDYLRILVDTAGLDWGEHERLRLVLDNLLDAAAPTNFPLTNPSVLKTTIDRGGDNLVQGVRAAVRDARSPLKLPASVDPTPFQVGETLAASPGAVVRREERYELIQYRPRTELVRDVPVLLVPPMISKAYIADLAPGKSMVEFLGDHQLQPFLLSWRNARREHAGWSLDDYLGSIVEAMETAREVTGSEQVHIVGFCAGGMASTLAVAHLAALGQVDRVASLNLMVTVLDTRQSGPIVSVASADAARVAKAHVARKGYLAGTELGRTFAWLRPNDMIWNNFVNNYYLGNTPPALDLLYWNADSMNMPAALHGDLLDFGLSNAFVTPGALEVLGTPLDPGQVTCDTYLVGGESDHLTPWLSCYRGTQLFGGEARFVLSNSGHIAAVIHPPGNPKSVHWIGDTTQPTGEQWLETAQRHPGTWWQDWGPWLTERSGEVRPAPDELGSDSHPAGDPAPGRYVFQQSHG